VVDSLQWVEKLLALGVRTLQLRIKSERETPALRQSIASAIKLAQEADAQLFINDHWQLACEYGAYGVHLGQEDLESSDLSALANAGLRLGISTHNLFEISVSLGIQPSYYALGHIFATQTKVMPGCPQGLSKLAQQARLLRDYPTVAIGGINRSNAERVLATGVSGLAVVRAITESSNLRGTVQRFKQVFERFGRDANINSESENASLN